MVNLAYDDRGSGEPVLFIAGRGGVGRTWQPFQVPAFLAAGYRVVTFDNRGVGATENADGFTTETMVADTAALIEKLGIAPTNIVGASMGAYIAQELMLTRPELVNRAALMAPADARTAPGSSSAKPKSELADSGVDLPIHYARKCVCWRAFPRRRSTTTTPCATGSTCSRSGRQAHARPAQPSRYLARQAIGYRPTAQSPHPCW